MSRKIITLLLVCLLVGTGGAEIAAFAQEPTAPQARIAVLGALPPLTDSTDADNAAATLKRAAFDVTIITPEQLADAAFFTPARFDALVVPHSRLFPAVSQANLLAYLRGRGKLLCIGGPAFSRYAFREGDAWKTRENIQRPLPAALAGLKPPVLECLSPERKVVHQGSEIAGAWLPVARERGIGLAGERPGRLLPVDPRGTETEYSPEVKARQWGYLCLSGSMRGAIWGATPKITPPGEPTFAPLAPIMKRLLQGVYLTKAGAERPAYLEGEPITLGATGVNVGATPQKVVIEVELHGLGEAAIVQKFIGGQIETIAPDAPMGLTQRMEHLPPGEYIIRATLFLENGAKEDDRPVLDRLAVPFRVVAKAAPVSQPGGIRVQKGGFALNGRAWNPVAIRFAPSWAIGQEAAQSKRGWLSPEQYDPELIERDLSQWTKQGVNLLCIVYDRPEQSSALLDFLERSRNHNLFVSVFVPEADPLHPETAPLKALLEAAQLPHHPAVFGVEIRRGPETTGGNAGQRAERIRFLHDLGVRVGRIDGKSTTDNVALRLTLGAAPLDYLLLEQKGRNRAK